MCKNGIPLFCFIFKMDTNEDIGVYWIARFFLIVRLFVIFQGWWYFTKLSLELKELISFEIFRLSGMVPEYKLLHLYIFNSVRQQTVYWLLLKIAGFYTAKNCEMRSINDFWKWKQRYKPILTFVWQCTDLNYYWLKISENGRLKTTAWWLLGKVKFSDASWRHGLIKGRIIWSVSGFRWKRSDYLTRLIVRFSV
jgi:hypothetical protein